MPGRSRGRPPRGASASVDTAQYSEAHEPAPPLTVGPLLTPLERQEFDFTDLDRWMRQADLAIRRTKAVLDRLAARPSPRGADGS